MKVRLPRLAGPGLAALLLLAAVPATTWAHPLGNFTVNRYSRVDVEPTAIRVRHVLDHAEIPSVQERQAADTNRDGTVSEEEWDRWASRKTDALVSGLDLVVDGGRVPLVVEQRVVSSSVGQADLPLVRLELTLSAPVPAASVARTVSFRDRNDPARSGWRELVVRAGDGVSLGRSTAPRDDVSNELRSYPEDLLTSPLDVRQADWSYTVAVGDAGTARRAPGASSVAADTAAVQAGRPVDPLTALVTVADLSPGVILLAMLASAFFGGLHAASPGHGKTVMAAYIVGSRGTVLHALGLAASVTVSHTAGVFILGAITVLASNLFFPEQLYPWLTLTSGVIVLFIGLALVSRAVHGTGSGFEQSHAHAHPHQHAHDHAPDDHAADRGHSHGDHGHRHDLPLTWRNLFALGLAGGIVPSASALVVLLSALALGRLGFGMLLIVCFGLGMAAVLTSTGVLLVYAGRLLARLMPEGGSSLTRGFSRAVPVLSALTMTLVGAVVTFQALGQFGFLAGR